MPSYPLSFPSGGVRSITVSEIAATASTRSPFSLKTQGYDWGGRAWHIDVEGPVLKEGDSRINDWVQFFRDCAGTFGTFTFNLSRYAPGQSGLTAVVFQMDQEPKYGMDKSRVFTFSFSATQKP